jgi:hypothetical protein
MRLEQIGFVRARRTAAHVDRRDGGLIEHDRGRAGREAGVVGIAHAQARDIGDEIA